MTKVLIISNKSDITSDFIVKSLRENSIEFYRFNTEELTKSVTFSLDFSSSSYQIIDSKFERSFNLQEFTSVYYRRPELPVFNSVELSIGEINFVKNEFIYALEGIYKLLRNAYWISPLYSIREAENKIYQLDIAKALGFKIPNSIITDSYKQVSLFFKENKEECVIKPIKSGLIEDNTDSKVVFTNVLKSVPENKQKISFAPNYLQSHIFKKGDIRVIVVGDKIFATLIHSQEYSTTKVDWRKGEMNLYHEKINLPEDIKIKCIALLRTLKLRYGAIDFILDNNGNYIFLEINPNGQWAWIEKQTGYKITQEIVNLLQNETF
ncbi:MvdC/MvdD family ATP grasp protein [Bizionia sp.]|uniref:MvdC/MvdD family ATP grasp protein n=1 Tax=Bizionia sp. TaxID=1954480 RepID=UPI003A92A7F2